MQGRRSFSFVRDEIAEDGSRVQINIDDDRITALTRSYREGRLKVEDGSTKLAAEQLKTEMEKELSRLKREKPLSAYNQEVLERYAREKIEIKRSCQRSTLNTDAHRAVRAIRFLANQSIRSVDVELIQNILDAQETENANRHLFMTFRRLLRYVGRKEDVERLRPKKYPYRKPPYLTDSTSRSCRIRTRNGSIRRSTCYAQDTRWRCFAERTAITTSLTIPLEPSRSKAHFRLVKHIA